MILKISLKPLDKFFFGGENGFQEAGQDKNNRRTTYVLTSRNYPQQTAALGLLRNQLLLQNELLWDNTAKITDRGKAKALIGRHGFRKDFTDSYGVIRKVGPVFLETAKGALWSPAPLDDVLMPDNKSMTLTRDDHQVWLKGYTEKAGCHASLQSDKKTLKTESAFLNRKQVGITKFVKPSGKPVPEEESENSYYFQTFKTFNADHADKKNHPDRFCFYAEVDTTDTASLKSAIVEFGGERSTFSMQVSETELSEIPLPDIEYLHTQRPSDLRSLVCLSPALVDTKAVSALAALMVSSVLPFRFLQSRINDKEGAAGTEYHQAVYRGEDKKQAKGALLESRLFQLLDRGSVVHFDPGATTATGQTIEESLKELFNQPDLTNIGYNQFTII